MTDGEKVMKSNLANSPLAAAGGVAMDGGRVLMKLIATFWRLLGALDAALWNGIKLFAATFYRLLRVVLKSIWRGFKDLVAWLPTRPGKAYSALSGIVLIIAGLWITDEVLLAPEAYQQPGEARPAAPVDKEDPILARMGGRYIHLSDVMTAAQSSGQLREGEILTPETAFSRGLVESYVEQRLLASAATAEGIQRSAPVARRLNAARDRILAASFLQRRIDAAVTPEAVEALYRAQAGVTRLGDEVKARHILVATREEAAEIMLALNAGADFAIIAREKSIDRSTAPLGGEIGYFTKDMMTPALANAAFSTEPGETAPPFETEFGWHILEISDRRGTSGVSFEAVDDNIRRFLTMRTIEQALAGLREGAKVTYYEVKPQENDKLEVPTPANGDAASDDTGS